MVAATLMLTPANAEARGHKHKHSHRTYTYCSGHTSCGCAVYTKRVFRYYDCHGHPVYSYYRIPVKHRCHSYRHGHNSHYGHNSYYGHGHNRYYSSRDRYSRGRTSVSYSTPYGTVRLTR